VSLRVFIAVTHLLGAGHLTRAAAIGRAFAAAGHRVTLVSGGMPAALIPTDGLDLIQLSPVRSAGEDFRSLLDADGEPASPAYLAGRRDHLLQAFGAAQPDVVITELYPFGRRILAPEFKALLDEARAQVPRPLVACSLRDILVAPVKPGRVEEAHRLVAEFYDCLLVHGDPALVRLDASWPVDDMIRSRLLYTGYVDGEPASAPGPRGDSGSGPILVAGGSSAAALPLYRAVLGAAALLPLRPWHMLVGSGVPAVAFVGLQNLAPANVVVERARPDFRDLMRDAAVFVGLAGYNTVVDLFSAGTRAVLVPFERGRETEQRLRAERLQAAGLATLLPETALSPETLAEAVHIALSRPRPGAAALDCRGAAATVAIIEAEVQRREGRHRPDTGAADAGVSAPALSRSPLSQATRALIRADLDRAADRGQSLPIWLRDDDAIQPTPALGRLLELAATHEMPVAIAAIPAHATPELAARLRAADAAVLVHGLTHLNHAPAGAKKAEFGAHRPAEILAKDAAEALRLACCILGPRVLPVFVPPWNRIAPDLVAALPSLGFTGLSTFGPRSQAHAPAQLTIVNTHLDPIDWRGGGGLIEQAAFQHQWRRALAPDLNPVAEPIGLLTHHLVMDAAIWAFCAELLAILAPHPAVVFPALAKLWPPASTLVRNATTSGA
jgi:predicted glycosyltransferase